MHMCAIIQNTFGGPEAGRTYAEYLTAPSRHFARKPAGLDHAHARGAYVIGMASPRNHDFLREPGADEMIDYHTTDFAEVVREIDVVLDMVGGDYPLRSLGTVRPGGLVLTIALRSVQARSAIMRGSSSSPVRRSV